MFDSLKAILIKNQAKYWLLVKRRNKKSLLR